MNWISQRSLPQPETIAIRVRWALLIAIAGLFFDSFSNLYLLGAIALFALANGVAWFAQRGDKLAAKATAIAAGMRFVDGIAISSIAFIKTGSSDFSWVLAVPLMLTHAMASSNGFATHGLALAMAGIQSYALIGHNMPREALLGPLATILLSDAFGVALAKYQARDHKLSKRDERLASVLSCGSALAEHGDLRQMMMHTLKIAVGETKGTCGYVMLLNDDDEAPVLHPEVAHSLDGEFDFPEAIPVGEGVSGYVVRMGQPLTVSSTGEHQDFDGITRGVRSAASVPLVSRGYKGVGQSSTEQVLGVMTILDLQDPFVFDDEDMELLRTLGSLMAVAISNAKMEERRRTTFLRTLESLATALEARDEYTRGHSQRVCELSLLIGEKLRFGVDALEELRVGTILHDIGKIGVPDAILNKRGRLTDEEFLVMKSHPVIGYEICRPLMLSEGVLMIIRNHHEKLDGSGYPDGLKGGELPLSLRIVCVADAFDAMSSRRPYRGVMDIADVLAELSRGAGTQFDPVVVESLKELLHNGSLNEMYSQFWEPPGEALAA